MATEYCSHCEKESEMLDVYKPQECEHCGEVLLPCRICTDLQDAHKAMFGWNVISCSACPFDYLKDKDKTEV